MRSSNSPDTEQRLLPLEGWPVDVRRGLLGVFTDIDDTLTTDGAITPDALAALHDLHAAGLHVVAITGRPAGWSEPFAWGDPANGLAPWPVDAIVAENGAVALLRPRAAGDRFSSEKRPERPSNGRNSLSKIYQQDIETRRLNAARLQVVATQILREVPTAKLAQDSPGRETDIAIDHSEFAHLPRAQIGQVLELMRTAGMHASVSSIHINGWFGAHDKLSGARWIVRELWGRALDLEVERWAYVGDSTNDQAMFRAFADTSIGVANIRRFERELQDFPKYVTRGERGDGFAEVARALLAAARG